MRRSYYQRVVEEMRNTIELRLKIKDRANQEQREDGEEDAQSQGKYKPIEIDVEQSPSHKFQQTDSNSMISTNELEQKLRQNIRHHLERTVQIQKSQHIIQCDPLSLRARISMVEQSSLSLAWKEVHEQDLKLINVKRNFKAYENLICTRAHQKFSHIFELMSTTAEIIKLSHGQHSTFMSNYKTWFCSSGIENDFYKVPVYIDMAVLGLAIYVKSVLTA